MSDFVRRKTKLDASGGRRSGIISCITILFLCGVCTRIHANTTNSTIEDQFIYQFGNLSRYRFWVDAREWYMDEDEPLLKRFVIEAHKLAGIGSFPVIDWLQLRERTLEFKNPAYLTRRLDVLEYSLEEEEDSTPWMDLVEFEKYKFAGEKWAITEGRRRECVYYLNLVHNASGPERTFHLKEEVCGINHLPTPREKFY